MPYYVEWLLSFPRAPLGSISIQIWAGACAAVISLVSAAFVSVYALLRNTRLEQPHQAKATPVATGSKAGTEKKEL